MKSYKVNCWSLLAAFLLLSIPANAALTPVAQTPTTMDSVEQLSREVVEIRFGRKLKLTERVALAVARGKIKRSERRARRAGTTRKTDGFAISSLACGLLSLGFFVLSVASGAAVLWFSFLWSTIAAMVFGGISLSRCTKNPERFRGRGLAIAGFILSAIGPALILGVVALFLLSGGNI